MRDDRSHRRGTSIEEIARSTVGAGVATAAGAQSVTIPAPVENFDTGEPHVDQIVHEDEGSRIEELRVRGETKRILVKTKGPLKGSYEILPDNAAKGVPQAPNGSRGVAGQRVWQVMTF